MPCHLWFAMRPPKILAILLFPFGHCHRRFTQYIFHPCLTGLAICAHWNDSNRAPWNLCPLPMWSSCTEIHIQSWPISLRGRFRAQTNAANQSEGVDACLMFFFLFSSTRSRLGVKSGGASVYHKTNRETMVEIGDSIRGKDIYIIQTGTKYDWQCHVTFSLIRCCCSHVCFYFYSMQRCQQQHHGIIDYGVCMQNIIGPFHRWRHTVFAVFETMQNA